MGNRRLLHALTALAFLAGFFASSPALAGGYEFPSLGTRPLGRGGAFAARADDPTALLHNPANLAALPGNQLLFNLSAAFFDGCYTKASTPTNTYGDVTGAPSGTALEDTNFAGTPWPEVCNEAIPTFIPTLIFTSRLNREWGIGAGILSPSAPGFGAYGDPDDAIISSAGEAVPTPNRYQLLEETILLIQPSVGVGYSPHPMIRFGATAQWGLAFVNFLSHTVTLGDGAENVGADVRTELSVKDLFVPGFILSAHLVPHDNIDVMVGFHWVDRVDAGGSIDFETNTYGTGSETETGRVPTRTKVDDVTFTAGIPWKLTFGLRYADRITPRPVDPAEVERLSGRVEDPMSNERWDVEFNAVYERSSMLDAFRITVPNGATVAVRNNAGAGVTDLPPLPVPPDNVVPHEWQDQLSLRLGGDYNVLPGLAALRLGVSYETSGQSRPYMQLDYWPVERFGVHAGATVRLGRFDISLAYAHFFQETVIVDPSEAKLLQLVATGTPAATNAGTYESNMDVLSLGLTWHM